jgi:2-aminoethylphosphonate-pyruvate transaminase
MEKLLLFTPGPVNVTKNVRQAVSREDICHREADFEHLLQSIERKLLQLFGIPDTATYRAVVITGSGTAANESILSSVGAGKDILVLSNGEFGERLFNISKIHNPGTSLLNFGWGKKLDLARIEEELEKNKFDVVAMVHHETSSGMLNDIEKIGTLLKARGITFVVDCVSSAGAEVIDMEKCHIAFCSSSSSKAICSYAGLSFVIGRKDEFEKLKDVPPRTTYLNLYKFYQFLTTASQTPNTPAIHLFYAFEQALMDILDEGVSIRHARIRGRARLLRRGMKRMGLEFLIDEEDMSSVLTTVRIPAHADVTTLRRKLRENSILVYEGKGCFKDKVFQVGNIGELGFGDIRFFLHKLSEALSTSAAQRKQKIMAAW